VKPDVPDLTVKPLALPTPDLGIKPPAGKGEAQAATDLKALLTKATGEGIRISNLKELDTGATI
jgi:hypothetical protein